MEVVDDLEAILKTQPHHPFTRLGLDSVRLSLELDAAIQSLLLALEKDGLKVEGAWRARGRYSDIHGLARPGNLVPATVAPGELQALIGRRVAVVGVEEVGDYDAVATAQALTELHGVTAFAEQVSIPDLPVSAALTDLYGRRAPILTKARAATAAYPPGFTNLPQDSFELLSTPPSPHGWRLQQAIGLGAIKATVQSGHHIGGGLGGGRLTSEPLLGLGVFHDGEAVGTGGTRLQHLQYIDAAEELRSGLRTDNQLHPLDESGQVPYTNLYAAGAVLGGYDYAGACGFGVPILTGWLAGRFAAKAGK